MLIADSDATRADLLRFYRLPDDKIRVVPLGVDPEFFEIARRAPAGTDSAGRLHAASAQEPGRPVARIRRVSPRAARSSGW